VIETAHTSIDATEAGMAARARSDAQPARLARRKASAPRRALA